MRIIGHRGAASHAPENTLAALEEGRRRGADWLEVDVRCSADMVPVLLHDPTLDRTTDGSGPVAAWESAALAGLDAGSWFGTPAFVGERLPTLNEALQWATARGARLALDVRADLGAAAFDAIGAAVRRVPRGADSVGLVLCGSPVALRALGERIPSADRVLLYPGPPDPAAAVAAAAEGGATVLHPNRAVVSEPLVAAARQAGLTVGVYLPPATTATRLLELEAWGVEIFNVDAPEFPRHAAATARHQEDKSVGDRQ